MRTALLATLLLIGNARAAEHVWHRLPDGFHPTNPVLRERLVARTWVPADQDDATWTQAFSVQGLPGTLRPAAELAAALDDISRRRCLDEGSSGTLAQGRDGDGTPYATTYHRCMTAQGIEASVQRVLEGRTGDYVVSIGFDHAPTREELDPLLPFVVEARLCDDEDPARACPAGGIAPLYVEVIHTGGD